MDKFKMFQQLKKNRGKASHSDRERKRVNV